MKLTNDQLLERVNTHIPNSIMLRDGVKIGKLLIVTENDIDLNRELLSRYKVGELTPEKVVELYGNTHDLQLYGVNSKF